MLRMGRGIYMAIYHLSVQIISRDQGKSCVAAAAYRSGKKLHDERQDLNHDYTKKQGIESEFIVPLDAPSWANDRERLWNEVDKAETRCNSRTAREINIALPIELSKEQQKETVRDYVKKYFVDKGMVADVCFHFNDDNNPHCHIMLTTREIDHEGFTKKNREWDKKVRVIEWRKEWEVMTNMVLKDHGIDARITCESHKNLGNEKIPTIHEGYVAREMEKNGKVSERVNQNRSIKDYNNTVTDLREYKDHKQENENHKNFYRSISPDEKRILKSAAKELKLYINYNNVSNRLEQLNRWQKYLSFQPESIDKTKKLERLGKEEDILYEVSNILETESNRFIQKNYSNLDIGLLNIDEKIQIVNDTINNKKTLMPEDFKNMPYKYTDIQQEDILNILDIKNDRLLKDKYPDFKINEAYKNMFYMECHSNKSLNIASKNLVDLYFSKDNFMKSYRVFETKDNDFVSPNKGESLLFEVIEKVINEIDNRVKEDTFEKDRLKKKSQKLKQKKQSQDLEL